MKSIGGFFELELPEASYSYHPDAIALSTGRACLRLMLRHIKIRKCYVPFYTCDAVFDPFILEGVEMEQYSINEQFEPTELPHMLDGEYFLYINYFGIKSDTVARLINEYDDKLIVDNTHLFFHKGYPTNWSFTSARKYFGVPDGAYLYAQVPIYEVISRFTDISINHNFYRLMGRQDQAHQEYTQYEKSLDSEIHSVSILSEKLLSLIDYEDVACKRQQNFHHLHSRLSKINRVNITDSFQDVPFAYPLLLNKTLAKEEFYKRGFFIPSLWSDPLKRIRDGFNMDLEIAQKLLPLPIDHRYNTDDMDQMAQYILDIV